MKVTSAIAFFSLLASGQATGAVGLNSCLSIFDRYPNANYLSTGALTDTIPVREDRLTSVTPIRSRASAGLTSLLALSPSMVAFPSLVSLVAMASVLALASVA